MGATVQATEPAERVLPREAMWFFVVAPPLLAFFSDPSCVLEPVHVARVLTAVTLYTVLNGLAVHYGFEWLSARMRARRVSPLLQTLAHGLTTAAIVLAVSLPLFPVISALAPESEEKEVTIIWRGVMVGLAYIAIARFIGHLQGQAVRERLQAHQQRTAALEARLNALQAQTQPHFLFNSLNAVASLIHTEPDLAEETIERLAALLRYALASTEKAAVPLREELECVRDYLEIQRLRFGPRLRYRFDVSADAEERRIPPMLVQPLVENAIVHGSLDGQRGGEVIVSARVSGDLLELRVEDDGVGPGRSTHRGTGTGLRNVQQRVELFFGEQARVETGQADSGGFYCALSLPSPGAR